MIRSRKDKSLILDALGRPIKRSAPVASSSGFLFGNRIKQTNSQKTSKRPYQYHSWVYACAHRIETNVSALPHVLRDSKCKQRGKDKDMEITYEHDLLDLFREPNPYTSGTELWEQIVLALMLPTSTTPGGQVFLVPENYGKDFSFKRGDIPKEIYAFTDEVVKPWLASGSKMLIGWKVKVPGMKELKLGLDEVIRVRLMNPYNIELGLSPYSAAEIAVMQDVRSDEFNSKFYDNMGAVGGTLSTDNDLTREQARRWKESWEEEYSGSANAGKTAVLGMGLKYDQFMKSHMDMQFTEQRKDNRTRIQAVYGVPDSELAIYESGMNRATAKTASRNFWEKTLLPIDKKIWDTLNIKWIKYVERGKWRGVSDLSAVEALREDFTEQIKDAKTLWEMDVPAAEALRVAQVPVDVDEYSWLEKKFVNGRLVDVELLEKNGTVPYSTVRLDEDDSDDNTKHAPLPRIESKATDATRDALEKKVLELTQRVEKTEKAKDRALKSSSYIRKVLNPGEKSMRPKWEKLFVAQRNTILDKIDAWLTKHKSKALARQLVVNPDDFLFDEADEHKKVMKFYPEETATQMQRELRFLKEEYGDSIQWGVNQDDIDKFVDRREKVLQSIQTTTKKTTRRHISQVVEESVKNNDTPAELAKKLKARVKDVMNKRTASASTIARTEIGAISSDARNEAFKSSGAIAKEWLTAEDELVRETHANQNGLVIPMKERFPNGLRYPHDPTGLPSETINCRCTILPVFAEDEKQGEE